jgi:hypothetical protein
MRFSQWAASCLICGLTPSNASRIIVVIEPSS